MIMSIMMRDDPNAVCCMIMLVEWRLLSIMMKDDHVTVCCMIMLEN